MRKTIIASIMATVLSVGMSAQSVDTTSIYKDRKDSLNATVFVGHQENSISRGKTLRTELISASGLQKMACCNLAESFENSASVTVGYSDAVTGARQIRLLGLSGTYTQMLDENRPVMRGITAPYGLSYVPGPWLESIQIAKGSPSVINGLESMTGQINLEHKKPTEEKPLFVQVSMMSDTKADFNATSAWQLSPTVYTILLGHVSGNFKTYDMNDDGFRDDPKMLQFNVANRWLYYTPELQVRWGVKAVRDHRQGGMDGYDKSGMEPRWASDESILEPTEGNSFAKYLSESHWGTDITNSLLNAYLKVGKPLREDGSSSIAAIADWSWQKSDSWFGASSYLASQQSGFINLLYRNMLNESHDFTVGLSGTFDHIDEAVAKLDYGLWSGENWNGQRPYSGIADHFFGGAYGEYTFHAGDIFTSIVGVSADWYKGSGFKLAPRVTLKYSPAEWFVARANGGRGLRYADPVADNIGVMSTHSRLQGNCMERLLEDSWTFGGNLTFYMPLGVDPSKTYISFDYFRTQFARQSMVDYEVPGADANGGRDIWFFDSNGRRSYSDNWQVDFNVEPFDTSAGTSRPTI
uniref:TonB-dependent receptor plug domain-containing protein n=1 Tax=Candidatus Cryptobacteroides bacterium TaxID=3085639 RepID=UPI0040280A38